MKVKEIMTRKVDCINPQESLEKATILMKNDDIGALPVGEKEQIVGMITDRDIIKKLATGKECKTCTVKEAMTSPHSMLFGGRFCGTSCSKDV